MDTSFNFAPVATLSVFVLGILFTPLLRKWDFFLTSNKKKKLLLTELADCRHYLRQIIVDHFKLLHTLEEAKDASGRISNVPIPIVVSFDLDFIKEFYKECLLQLTVDERHLVRGVPENLKLIKTLSSDFQHDVLNDNYYNVRALRNIIWTCSVLYCQLEQLQDGSYKRDETNGSVESAKQCLMEFGYTEEQISKANALKSMLTKEQRDSVKSEHQFFVPE